MIAFAEFATFTLPSWPELASAIPVIISLIIIEGLLSVDNALAIAAMANHLPEKQRIIALRLGILGAYAFRGLALWLAAWILQTPWVMWCGAIYLVYLMCDHFAGSVEEPAAEHPGKMAQRGFWGTIVSIEIMDLSLSVDNVLAAAAMDRRLWVVCLGVFIGILALRLVAGWCLGLLKKYPVLEHTAFLLIGWVGFILVGELLMDWLSPLPPREDGTPSHHHIAAWQKFAGIAVILFLSIGYGRSPGIQRTLRPVLAISMRPVLLVSRTVGGVVNLMMLPFLAIGRAFKRRRAANAPDGGA